ncbi:hypothetical protein ABIC56_000896 [Acinetobacter bereziniae]|uniref:hypothetical protein n=1 Tax=Acinetobacter bereziniae TaxID=106648 RepID=UPI0028620688|nr:hypothetical protein [Acinetobacter bereziniae]MDR6540352.1 hypothetical protein [Acinetobacter bereziniae]
MNVNIEKYRDLKKTHSLNMFKKHRLKIFKETLENFLNCRVIFFYEPTKQIFDEYGINLLENPNRGCYNIDNNNVIIFIRILSNNELISGLAILIHKSDIDLYSNFFQKLEGSLTHKFSIAFAENFENSSLQFGDDLIKHIITNYCSKGFFDYRKFKHLVDYFIKLSSLTFEGEYFSTGIIITKSLYAYKKRGNHDRNGDLYTLSKNENLLNTFNIKRRFWYLVDGKHSFYICNKNLAISDLFIINNSYNNDNYLDNHSLSKTLKGSDVLLKIENKKNLSIIKSNGLEFLYQECNWKVRNYNSIKKELSKVIYDHHVINKILFFILYCSKNFISSVIWIPRDTSNLENYLKRETLNTLTIEKFSILESQFTNHIFRFLSSDGATIINKDGYVLNYGCIVDMKSLEIQGVKGAGESAAEVLGHNGISFKISQDGTIKLFIDSKKYII